MDGLDVDGVVGRWGGYQKSKFWEDHSDSWLNYARSKGCVCVCVHSCLQV